MPNRVLRDWTNSDKVDALCFQSEVFFTRLIMKADDYGCFYADTRLLKANLFPLKLDKVREADLTRWLAECHRAGLIVLYEHNQKRYLQIIDFRQRLDKARAKFPLPPENHVSNEFREFVTEFPAESEAGNETNPNPNLKPNGAKALVGADADLVRREQKKEYDQLLETLSGRDKIEIWNSLRQFISDKKPMFIEPYMDAWNVFAMSMRLIKEPSKVTDKRRKKFHTRIGEPEFDFLKILEKIKKSPFLKGDNNRNWRVSIEFILDSEENYTKILEEKYD